MLTAKIADFSENIMVHFLRNTADSLIGNYLSYFIFV
jgi:hypothetical protein